MDIHVSMILRNLVWDYEQKLSLFSFDNSESVEIYYNIVLAEFELLRLGNPV